MGQGLPPAQKGPSRQTAACAPPAASCLLTCAARRPCTAAAARAAGVRAARPRHGGCRCMLWGAPLPAGHRAQAVPWSEQRCALARVAPWSVESCLGGSTWSGCGAGLDGQASHRWGLSGSSVLPQWRVRGWGWGERGGLLPAACPASCAAGGGAPCAHGKLGRGASGGRSGRRAAGSRVQQAHVQRAPRPCALGPLQGSMSCEAVAGVAVRVPNKAGWLRRAAVRRRCLGVGRCARCLIVAGRRWRGAGACGGAGGGQVKRPGCGRTGQMC